MRLPSETIRHLEKNVSFNGLTQRNMRWIDTFYYKNRDELGILERNPLNDKFVVGKIYTFFYFNPKYKDILEFWSSVPVGLYLGDHQTSKNPLFLNLQFIPHQIRIQILDKIVKMNAANVDAANKQIVDTGQSYQPLSSDYYDLKKFLKGSGFEFAIRSYIKTRINSKPLIISYYDWWRIGTLSSNKHIRKKDVRAIYILYKRAIGRDPFKKGGLKPLKIK